MNTLKTGHYSTIIRKPGKPLPIYEQIRRQLITRIQSGAIRHGEELPATTQIVKELGVGYHAVKTALSMLENEGLVKFKNGKGRGKRPVISIKMKDQKQCTVTFLRTVRDHLDLQITHGFYQYCQENSLKAIVFDCPLSDAAFAYSIRNSESDGIMILPHGGLEVAGSINDIINKGRNVVLVDRSIKNVNASSVSIDNVYGAYLACCHLFDSKNMPIYYFGYRSNLSSIDERFNGWKIAMLEHNFNDFQKYAWILERDQNEHNDYAESHLQRLYEHQNRFLVNCIKESGIKKFCIFTVHDYVAKSVYTAASELGLEIGKDIFVASFGNSPFCKNLPVQLTSIEQKNKEVGYEAAKLLHMKLTGASAEKTHKKIAPELIIRQSS